MNDRGYRLKQSEVDSPEILGYLNETVICNYNDPKCYVPLFTLTPLTNPDNFKINCIFLWCYGVNIQGDKIKPNYFYSLITNFYSGKLS